MLSMDFLVFLVFIFLLLSLVAININLYIRYRNRNQNQIDSNIISIQQALDQIEKELNSYELSDTQIMNIKNLCPTNAISENNKGLNLIKIRCFGFSCFKCIEYIKENSN